MMTPTELARIMASIQRGRAAMDRMRELNIATTRSVNTIRRALAPGQAQRRLRKWHMGRR